MVIILLAVCVSPGLSQVDTTARCYSSGLTASTTPSASPVHLYWLDRNKDMVLPSGGQLQASANSWPCKEFPDTMTCCKGELLKEEIKKTLAAMKDRWTTYINSLRTNIYDNGRDKKIRAFYSRYYEVAQIMANMKVSTMNIFPLSLANREAFDVLKQYFQKLDDKFSNVANTGQKCFDSLSNFRARVMCELCKMDAPTYVNATTSRVRINAATSEYYFTDCNPVFQLNYYLSLTVNLLAVVDNERTQGQSTFEPSIDYSALGMNVSRVNDVVMAFKQCESDCTDINRRLLAEELLSLGVSDVLEGSVQSVLAYRNSLGTSSARILENTANRRLLETASTASRLLFQSTTDKESLTAYTVYKNTQPIDASAAEWKERVYSLDKSKLVYTASAQIVLTAIVGIAILMLG